MEQDQAELEEGEIQDDDTEVYVPLERPQNYASVIPQKRFPIVDNQYSDSEEEQQSSGSDSDLETSNQRNKKVKKIKIVPKPLKCRSEKNKKYDVWSTRAQEDVLAETMNSCDVTIKDRSRSVESYDYNLARQLYAEENSKQNYKRTRDDRKNVNFKPRKRSDSSERKIKGTSRVISDLTVDITNSVDDIAKDIANKLCEEREDLIIKVLNTIGKRRTIEIFDETKQIESNGGMLIMNQTRRRTPGGVFLFLVRHNSELTAEERKNIFNEDRQKYNKAVKDKKKEKIQKMKCDIEIERGKLFPELLTRAELFATQDSTRKLKKTDESNCTNPPPSPETDNHESCDGMESASLVAKSQSSILLHSVGNNCMDSTRGKPTTYDEDYLDIGCDNMDLF
ncbi:phosphorylated adaptor for RNA export isoform X2 [Rhynchophorus ferrugineus]|uniref:Phosphorylated adapter RNA export protein n=1 Tax=Rhynchophorus ferrugineus TaxID=354439 RepID=A0A834ILF1_RHYFE|nr:hypothetical protein GWI33_006325 [Rhynchophorus ferrugineus]